LKVLPLIAWRHGRAIINPTNVASTQRAFYGYPDILACYTVVGGMT